MRTHGNPALKKLLMTTSILQIRWMHSGTTPSHRAIQDWEDENEEEDNTAAFTNVRASLCKIESLDVFDPRKQFEKH